MLASPLGLSFPAGSICGASSYNFSRVTNGVDKVNGRIEQIKQQRLAEKLAYGKVNSL